MTRETAAGRSGIKFMGSASRRLGLREVFRMTVLGFGHAG